MLSEISQTEIYTVWSHLNVESKNPYKLIEKEIRFEVTKGRGGTGGEKEGGQKSQASSYKQVLGWTYREHKCVVH